jgi:RNA polymerase sigma factor (TIGR02999 family)
MSEDKKAETAVLIAKMQAGDEEAAGEFMRRFYNQLRAIAGHYLKQERADHTLQPTALVHEAFMKLTGKNIETHDLGHYQNLVAKKMRQILVNWARGKNAKIRGEGANRVSLSAVNGIDDSTNDHQMDLLDLHDALNKLPVSGMPNADRKTQVIEQKYFGGETLEQIAKNLGWSPETVKRDHRLAIAWLLREMSPDA